MGRWPKPEVWPLPFTHTLSVESCGIAAAEMSIVLESCASATWPVANLAIYVPVDVYVPSMVTKMGFWSGNSTGNYDIGLYGPDGTRLASSGSVAMSGTDAMKEYDPTDFLIAPGRYYMALALSSTSGSVGRIAPTEGLAGCQAMGLLQQASALPLPAIATFATIANNYVPMLGVAFHTATL